jgi:hypothetical protein
MTCENETRRKEKGEVMKVCECCGIEIGGRDGDNRCVGCHEKPASRRKGMSRKERDAIMRSFGLVKVRGARGGTYYE